MKGGTVKLDVQMSTAGQIDCGCPESGGRLAVLGTVDFCPADLRILRDVGTRREDVLECAAHQDFIQLISKRSCITAKFIGLRSVGDIISNSVNLEGRLFDLEKLKRSLRDSEKFH